MIGFGSGNVPTQSDAAKRLRAQEQLRSPRMSQTLQLKSGEQMSYASVGDSQGIVCVWFGGPASTRHLIALYHEMCVDLGIQLFFFDRPGRGASTPLRNPKDWTFSSWAAYILEATDLLNIPKFYPVAHSFGCSYLIAGYPTLRHKIQGGLRFLATWAPSNLPCMPTSYAVQRSMPTKMLRAWTSFSQSSTVSSMSSSTVPCQMGAIGNREKEGVKDIYNKEVMDRVALDHLGDSYPAYELDWLLALEVNHPLGYNHASMDCNVKCWHGMDDTITPLGAAMWMQREMDHFLLFAVEGATHNIHLDFAIVKAMFADIKAADMTARGAVIQAAQEVKAAEMALQQGIAGAEEVASNQETVMDMVGGGGEGKMGVEGEQRNAQAV